MEQQSNNWLPIKKFATLLLTGLIVGGLADIIAMSDKPYSSTSNFALGFFAIIPVVVLLLVSAFNFLKIKSKILIISVTTALFFLAMIFGFWFYNFRAGPISDMYGLFYFLGAIPSIVIGLLFGIYIARLLNRSA
jgi:hypothetical protein